MASRPTRRLERAKTVKVRLGKLGSEVQELRLRSGTTVKDLVKARGLYELSIRLNGNVVRLSTQLKDGDLVVAVPPFIVGASAGRYDHLDLDKYRRTMSPPDFNFFVNFVGADALGFRDEDLEPC
jgi:molybdopterin converting factor small subunit